MANIVSKVVGIISFVAGSIVLAVGKHVDRYHFGFHVVWGIIAASVGFLASRSVAKVFCLISGFFYLALSVPGFFLGDPAMNRDWPIGPTHLMLPDHILHAILGVGLVAVGLLSKTKTRTND
ncbi:MAG TPA: hypothetical protein VGP81_05615 [Pyrinomonadaceae bacterium]|jgi:hypothetical protein|nr:hypothetical protein [Pyrinomonadaceae bacterium]